MDHNIPKMLHITLFLKYGNTQNIHMFLTMHLHCSALSSKMNGHATEHAAVHMVIWDFLGAAQSHMQVLKIIKIKISSFISIQS